MPKKRWFRLFGMDCLASPRVQAMTNAQFGAYVRLLILAWDDPNCSLPANRITLNMMAKWDEKDAQLEPVLECFAKHPTKRGRLYNPRLYEEFQYCQEKSKKAEIGRAHV